MPSRAAAAALLGVGGRDGNDLVEQLYIEHSRHEARPDALNVAAGLPPDMTGYPMGSTPTM